MRIVVAGGSGFLGTALVQRLRQEGQVVSVLTRRPRSAGDVEWSPGRNGAGWAETIRNADAVVNLAGASIAGGRWTERRKQLLRSSRLEPTHALVREIVASPRPPVFVSVSGVGYYGLTGDRPITESAPAGSDFLATLCRDWEAAANAAAAATRVVLVRPGLVMSRAGGGLPQLARPFWFFVGGRIGSGRQYLSWIHVDDWLSMVVWALTNGTVTGPLNATAPEPVTNAQLARSLGSAIGRPSFMTAPSPIVRLALGEMADAAILNGQRVFPEKALAMGFRFQYPTIDAALRAIYR